VAAAQEAESRYALRALCLLAVLVLSKAATLVLVHGRVTFSPWAPIAYFWQDVLVALIFFGLDAVLRRPRLAWVVYGTIAGYAAVNVPVTAVLSTPLTRPLIRAAGAALSDSITHYVTAANLLGAALPAAAAVLLPRYLRKRRATWKPIWVVGALACVLLGPHAVTRVETRGLHRNAVGAIVATSLPRLSAVPHAADWRVSPFPAESRDDLSSYRGIASRRNVVIVVLESTAAQYAGLYGASQDPLPTLTALSRDAIVFNRAYAVYPESIKGLFSTLCSRYPAFDTDPELYAAVNCSSLAERLGSAGYRTALFHSGRFDYLGMRAVIDRRGFDLLEDAGAIGGNVQSSFGVDEDATVRRILSWIDARDTRVPFFVTYLPIAGHHPYAINAPGPFRGESDLIRYLNALHEGDRALGELIKGFRDRGLDRETLFVIFGDHGEAFGQHPGNFAHTLFIYEENIRVPYLIVAPGAFNESKRVMRLASAVDTMPTVLDLLGLEVPAGLDGVSLLSPTPSLSLFFTDYSLGWLGLADECWKYLYQLESGRSYLFDLCLDPAELEDLAAAQPVRVAAYRDRVQQWAAAQKARFGPPAHARRRDSP
jgi:glucan phosphoethanolaminetransferase (alkaline phosphatase superfamily)